MALATPNRDGGRTDERGILRAVGKLVSGNVISGFRVRQNTTPNMSVLIGGETGIDDDLLIRNTAYRYSHPVFIDDGTAVSASIATANTSNPRIDVVVVYVDYSQTPTQTVSNNTNGVIKVAVVSGAPAAVPVRPSDSTVSAAIGAANYWAEVGQILLPANATTVTNGMITDTRTMASAVLSSSSISTPKIADGAITPTKRTGGFATGVVAAAALGSIGNKSITGVGFTPKLVRFTVLPTGTGAVQFGVGAMTTTSQYYSAVGADSGSGRTRLSGTDGVIAWGTTGATPDMKASYVSMDADGFTINVSVAQSSFAIAWEAYA